MLTKASAGDFDTRWADPPEGGGLATFLVNAPLGVIVAWSGTEDNVPEGWSICNGENGTIDLLDKFVLGSGPNHAVGETGGSEEVTLTVAQLAKHSHGAYIEGNTSYSEQKYALKSAGTFTNKMGTTSISKAGSDEPHPNMPPYYTLLYIQKTSATPTDYMTTEEVMAAIQEAVSNIPASGGVPINTITIWSGSVEDIPAGWVLCDGQDGRPDLRGRFVLGAGGAYTPGAAGGSEEVTLTVDQLAKHSHGQYVPASATGSTSTGYTNLVNPASTSNPVSGRPYKDGLFGSSTSANQVNTKMQGNNEPHENMPPYYALCYIIKVSGDAPSGIEEFDTEDGWHVRKWSDGYIEMFHSRDVQVTTDMWSAWGSIFSVSVDKIPAVNYPVLLVRKYNENTAANYPFSDATGLIYGPSHEDKTQNIGFFRGTEAGVNLTIKLQYRVCGTWK